MKKKVLEEIKKKFGEEFDFEEKEVTKNNDKVLHGVIIKKKGEMMSPVVYIDGVPEDKIADFMFSKYEEAMESMPTKTPEKLKEMLRKENLLENVFPALMNRKKNKKRLEGIAHRPFLDLEITYRIDIGSSGFITITNEILEHEGVTEEELYKASLKNIRGKAKCCSILDMLPIPVEKVKEDERENPPALVVTNEDNALGAGMILDEDLIEFLSEKIGNFYVIPSSIHEMLIVPDAGGDAKRLSRIVKETNKECIPEQDFLSDTLYVCRDGKIEVA